VEHRFIFLFPIDILAECQVVLLAEDRAFVTVVIDVLASLVA
jgi:hypothetical protein